MNITIEDKQQGIDYYILQLEDEDIFESSDKWGHELFPEQIEWCRQTFGDEDIWGELPVTGWKRMRNKFFFTTEDQRTLFALRWS